jgi:hypothetical protein
MNVFLCKQDHTNMLACDFLFHLLICYRPLHVNKYRFTSPLLLSVPLQGHVWSNEDASSTLVL